MHEPRFIPSPHLSSPFSPFSRAVLVKCNPEGAGSLCSHSFHFPTLFPPSTARAGSGHSLGDKIEGPQFFSKEMRQPSRTITGLHLAESRTSPEVMADESSAGATEFAAATDTATSTAAVEDDSNDRGFSTSLIVHEEEGTVGGTEAATVAFPAVKEGCNDHRFSVMAQCLNALGLVTKGAEHKLTVFAPTDASFHKLFASIQHVGPVTVDVLRNNRELRRMVSCSADFCHHMNFCRCRLGATVSFADTISVLPVLYCCS